MRPMGNGKAWDQARAPCTHKNPDAEEDSCPIVNSEKTTMGRHRFSRSAHSQSLTQLS